ncbi:hypothetical protein [Nodosilinea sp. E11]|uniref:hypothetical protein n=1 Tax=Nodosilinea sp. E11 TaxID=3037479 RepID=UPI002934C83D|nr:hypothetical protein [Nodosilinea sp. E11]WOD39830.1 hypothetical protein RRF56_03360 [Nodosilinea sp. E11]
MTLRFLAFGLVAMVLGMPHPALSQDTLFEVPASEFEVPAYEPESPVSEFEVPASEFEDPIPGFEAPVYEQGQNATFESTAGVLSLADQGERLSTTQVSNVIITVPEGRQATIRLAPPQQVQGPASPEITATASAEINGIALSSDRETTATLSSGVFTLPVRLEVVSPRLFLAGDYAYTVEVLMQLD